MGNHCIYILINGSFLNWSVVNVLKKRHQYFFLYLLQLYYRAIREIQAGEEMLLYAKDRLYPQKDIEDYRKMDDGMFTLSRIKYLPENSYILLIL